MFGKMVKLIAGMAITGFFITAPAGAMPLTNYALTGTATQSSTYLGWAAAAASNAIDGNTNGIWNYNPALNSISHTNSQFRAWWQVDLGQSVNINNIVVWNRTNSCCVNRLNNFSIFLDGLVIGSYNQNSGPSPDYTLSNINKTGQVVRVQLNDTNYLHLAEVQVFGTAAKVPEPAPLTLLGLGLLGLGIARKRRK